MDWFLYDSDLRHERFKIYEIIAWFLFLNIFWPKEIRLNYLRESAYEQ